MKTLGILVSSAKFADQLEAIVEAARTKKIALRFHFTGPGVHVVVTPHFKPLLAHRHVTVCRESAQQFDLTSTIEQLIPGHLTSSEQDPAILRGCDKRLVL